MRAGLDRRDPADPRRDAVLPRWFQAVAPLLKTYYSTGGDLNVDELHDAIPLTERHGLRHPQEGVVSGHFRANPSELIQKVGQLRLGAAKPVEDARFSPATGRKYTVADLITGWGVAESVRHYYQLYGGDLAGRRVVVEGWGNVGSAAAYYLSQAGARIVGILDRTGGLLAPDGLGAEAVHRLFLDKSGNQLMAADMIPFAQANEAVWDIGAFEGASNAELKPRKLEGTLAFMFETRFSQRVTRFAAEAAELQASYGDYGQALKRYFDPTKP